MSKLIKVGDEYHMINDDDTTISVKESVSFLALSLVEDLIEMDSVEKDIQKKIATKCMALNAITNAAQVIR